MLWVTKPVCRNTEPAYSGAHVPQLVKKHDFWSGGEWEAVESKLLRPPDPVYQLPFGDLQSGGDYGTSPSWVVHS